MTTPSPSAFEQKNALQAWREAAFSSIIRFISYVGSATYIILIGFVLGEIKPIFFIAYTLAYLLVMVAAFATRIPTIYRAYMVVALLYLLGVFSSVEKAAIGDGRIWFVVAAIFTVVFLGQRTGLVFTVIGTLTWGLLGYLFNAGVLPKPGHDQFAANIWIGTTVTLLTAGLSTVLSIGALLKNLNKTIEESSALARTSDKQSKELEEQHNTLQRRSNALEASARISRKVAPLTSADDILLQAPIMIKNEYELLSAAFFTLGQDSLLRLVSCEGWNEQAHPKHAYSVALEDDIVGFSIINDQALSNTTSGKGLRASLPDTRSFAAIPMRGRSSNATGVLLLQSSEFDGLGSERLPILQMLADQITILMENADLLVAKESALEAERRAYGEITESAWNDFISKQHYGGYTRDESGLHLVSVKPSHAESESPRYHQVPIQIRDRVIGYIDAHKPENRAWTVSEKELLKTLAGRLENALDSARLYDEIQERATREHLVSAASSRMRETLNVQAVLQAAAEELHKALGSIAETEIWIAPEEINDNPAID